MSRKFDPTKYETVKERKARFRKKFEDGRIVVKIINPESAMDHSLFEARVFKDAQDQEKDLPLGVGFALEVRDKELSVSNSGQKYESVNYTSWTENCEESAVGRALDNAGFAPDKAPSREEMEKVERMSTTLSKPPQNPLRSATEGSKVNPLKATEKQVKAVYTIGEKNGFSREQLLQAFGVESLSDISRQQASQFIDRYGEKKDPEEVSPADSKPNF